jgi:molecular chaperone DnaJ
VLIHVAEDERFVREGDDLITLLDVPAPLAALGASFEVATLSGSVSVEVASGTQPGEVITLRGQGMPRLQRHGHGDLRVVVNVQIPRRLSDEQRSLLEALSATITEENLRAEESMFARLRRTLRSHG